MTFLLRQSLVWFCFKVTVGFAGDCIVCGSAVPPDIFALLESDVEFVSFNVVSGEPGGVNIVCGFVVSRAPVVDKAFVFAFVESMGAVDVVVTVLASC